MIRFNFVPVTKVNPGGARRHPVVRHDTIRLTGTNLIIGRKVSEAFKTRKITLEKDVDGKALRVVAVKEAGKNVFKLNTFSNGSLFTGRPGAAIDMPNGNYEQDLKDPSVFVLV